MTIHFQCVQLGSPRGAGEGLRIGTVRRPPRGVPKSEFAKLDFFDVWLPILAPSRELLQTFRASKNMKISTFFSRYRTEMSETNPRQVIQVLAELSKTTPISVGCFCSMASRCHRSVLAELIREAAGLPPQRPLFEQAVYTTVHWETLDNIFENESGTEVLSERKRWTTAHTLWRQGEATGYRFPIIFSDATDCSRLLYWGQIENLVIDDEGTVFEFSHLTPIRGKRVTQELVLSNTGKTIAPGFIRPYALVQTPKFL